MTLDEVDPLMKEEFHRRESKRYLELKEELSKPSKAKPEFAFWVYLILPKLQARVSPRPVFFSRDLNLAINTFLNTFLNDAVIERRAAVLLDEKIFILNLNALRIDKEGTLPGD